MYRLMLTGHNAAATIAATNASNLTGGMSGFSLNIRHGLRI